MKTHLFRNASVVMTLALALIFGGGAVQASIAPAETMADGFTNLTVRCELQHSGSKEKISYEKTGVNLSKKGADVRFGFRKKNENTPEEDDPELELVGAYGLQVFHDARDGKLRLALSSRYPLQLRSEDVEQWGEYQTSFAQKPSDEWKYSASADLYVWTNVPKQRVKTQCVVLGSAVSARAK